MSAAVIAALALVAVAIAFLPAARRAVAPYLLAGRWAYAVWRARAVRRRAYHRARYRRPVCHARPTRSRRARLVLTRFVPPRLRITSPPKARIT